jgi:hypothetical protein
VSADTKHELRPVHVLSAQHGVAMRLGEQARMLPFREDSLYGTRSVKKPLIAITAKKEPGPVRHALSQMVVAGTMTVHQSPAGVPLPSPGSQPRVFTFTPPPVSEKTEQIPPKPAVGVIPPRVKTAPPAMVERTVIFDFNAPPPIPTLPED